MSLEWLAGYRAGRHPFQAEEYSLVALSPVVSRSSLSENKVVRAEDLAVGTSTDGVHGSRLKIHEHSARNVATASCLIEVNVDALQLKIRVSMVGTSGINTYFEQMQATSCQDKQHSTRIFGWKIAMVDTIFVNGNGHSPRQEQPKIGRKIGCDMGNRIPDAGGRTLVGCASLRSGNEIQKFERQAVLLPCSSEITSQNLAPIWLPHCPP
jgi:hypothetical protein